MPTCNTYHVGGHLAGIGASGELEMKLAGWYGLQHALAVSSATSGLMGLALALDLAGCEFITTPYTWGGSLASWLTLGCRPVFADINPTTLTIDPESVRARISSRTRAILAVDINGTPCDSASLREVADEHGVWYIADAAQSLGARRSGWPASVHADALVVSFSTGKPLDVSEGGAVITPHVWLHQRLVWHTQHPQRQAREIGLGLTNEFGINARIHPAAAADAITSFSYALDQVRRRQDRCFSLLDALAGSGLTAPVDMPGVDDIRPSFYRLSVAARTLNGDAGDQLEQYLGDAGFRAHVEPSPVRILYRLPSFPLSRIPVNRCPVAEDQHDRRWVVRLREQP